eukprot:3513362-Rhodomonas_salina.6
MVVRRCGTDVRGWWYQHILLGRKAAWPNGSLVPSTDIGHAAATRYSILAGFTEMGERSVSPYAPATPSPVMTEWMALPVSRRRCCGRYWRKAVYESGSIPPIVLRPRYELSTDMGQAPFHPPPSPSLFAVRYRRRLPSLAAYALATPCPPAMAFPTLAHGQLRYCPTRLLRHVQY